MGGGKGGGQAAAPPPPRTPGTQYSGTDVKQNPDGTWVNRTTGKPVSAPGSGTGTLGANDVWGRGRGTGQDRGLNSILKFANMTPEERLAYAQTRGGRLGKGGPMGKGGAPVGRRSGQ